MSTKDSSSRTMSMADDLVIPQYSLSKILFMYAWPLAWFAFLLYVIAPLFLRPDGTLPLWGNPLPLFGVSLTFRLVLALPVLATALTVAALVYTVLAWKDRFWGLAGRVHYTLVTVAAVAFVWFLNYWNLLGWRF